MMRDGTYKQAKDLVHNDSLMPLYRKYPDEGERMHKIICKESLNHKVVSVNYVAEKQDVYDLTISDNHNFALSCGIFVHNSKDQADAVCGACFAAGKFSNEYSYDYGDNLAATLSANETDDIANNAAKLTEMFQKELAQLYSDAGLNSTGTDEATVEQKEQIDSYQNYLDIMDGILVL